MTDVSQDKLMPCPDCDCGFHDWRHADECSMLKWTIDHPRPPTDVSTDGLVAEWKRLEDAFHDNLPSQGECGDPSHGKALCQFLYDNSEKIRASLAALERRIAELEGETHKALEWALGVAAGVVEMGDPGYEHACDVFEQLDRKALSHSSETGK